jgi:hypothetical protein
VFGVLTGCAKSRFAAGVRDPEHPAQRLIVGTGEIPARRPAIWRFSARGLHAEWYGFENFIPKLPPRESCYGIPMKRFSHG